MLSSDGGRQIPGDRQLEGFRTKHLVGELPEQRPHPERVAVGLGPELGGAAALEPATERGGHLYHRRLVQAAQVHQAPRSGYQPSPTVAEGTGEGRPHRGHDQQLDPRQVTERETQRLG